MLQRELKDTQEKLLPPLSPQSVTPPPPEVLQRQLKGTHDAKEAEEKKEEAPKEDRTPAPLSAAGDTCGPCSSSSGGVGDQDGAARAGKKAGGPVTQTPAAETAPAGVLTHARLHIHAQREGGREREREGRRERERERERERFHIFQLHIQV